jgi:hypothetical protein
LGSGKLATEKSDENAGNPKKSDTFHSSDNVKNTKSQIEIGFLALHRKKIDINLLVLLGIHANFNNLQSDLMRRPCSRQSKPSTN